MSRAYRSLVIPNHGTLEIYPLQYGKPMPGKIVRACLTHNRGWFLIDVENRAIGDVQQRIYADNISELKDRHCWPANVSLSKLNGDDLNALGVLGVIKANTVARSRRDAQFEADYQSELSSLKRKVRELSGAGLIRRIDVDNDKMRDAALREARRDQKRHDKRERDLKLRRQAHNVATQV